MLEIWCDPVDTSKIRGYEHLDALQVGSSIVKHDDDGMPEMKDVQVALVGIGAVEADEVRNSLYFMSGALHGVKIADVGNLKKSEANFVIPVMHELLDGGIIPVLIGSSKSMMDIQYKAYLKRGEDFRMALIDSVGGRLNAKEGRDSLVFDVLSRVGTPLVDFALLGYQTHMIHPDVLSDLKHRQFSLMRLGKAQEDIEETEPFLRNMDAVAFCLSALRYSEAPGQLQNYPSGFFSEEACQLARYAGISDQVTSFGIYGYLAGIEPTRVTQTMVAQLIWYFIEGVSHRFREDPSQLTQSKEYLVDISTLATPITFVKSLKSGRWWIRTSGLVEGAVEHLPCSPSDYTLASQGQLPDRLYQHLVKD